MNAPDDIAQGGMHRPVTGDTGLTGKGLCPDAHVEMRLPAFAEPRMATMAFAVIDHLQLARGKRLLQAVADFVGYGHLSPVGKIIAAPSSIFRHLD